eukprot:CAMPEP_0174698462 /NCGR_PEP_ID=MMETSP1094-20130205/4062_1 /TAXON_ID=156173 /ORGANISM="Chrysochromulina brevifilum, Strain UTEX LB 985" /LENGTH=40 /DNA_ID= /DNA_START= /DNA_END= /DNA_ORIENTATION=
MTVEPQLQQAHALASPDAADSSHRRTFPSVVAILCLTLCE